MTDEDTERDFRDFSSLPYRGAIVPELFNDTGNAGDGKPGLQRIEKNWVKNYLSGGIMESGINLSTFDLTGNDSKISGFISISGITGIYDKIEGTFGARINTFSGDYVLASGDYVVTSGDYKSISGRFETESGDYVAHKVLTTGAHGTLLANVVEDTTPQLGGSLDLNEKSVDFNRFPTSDHTVNGICITGNVATSVAFGNLLCLNNNGAYILASSGAVSTLPAIAMATETKTTGQVCKLLLMGAARDDSWTFTTLAGTGCLLFLGKDGAITQTCTGLFVQCVGYAVGTGYMVFNPDKTYYELY